MDIDLNQTFSSSNPWLDSATNTANTGRFSPATPPLDRHSTDTDTDWSTAGSPTPTPRPSQRLRSQNLSGPSIVTPTPPSRVYNISNISMHAENSPNRPSLHVYPPKYSNSSSSAQQSSPVVDTITSAGSLVITSNNDSAALTNSDSSLVQRDESNRRAAAEIPAIVNGSEVSVELVLHDGISSGQVADQRESESPVSSLQVLNSTQPVASASEESGDELFLPGYLTSENASSSSYSLANFAFNQPRTMLNLLQLQMPRRMKTWGLGAASGKHKRSPSPLIESSSSKVRIIPTPSIDDAIGEARESVLTEFQKEKEKYEKKITDQQMIIDMLKAKLRDSEKLASREAVSELLNGQKHSQEIKRARERIESVRSKFDRMRRDLDEQYKTAIEDFVNLMNAELRAPITEVSGATMEVDSNDLDTDTHDREAATSSTPSAPALARSAATSDLHSRNISVAPQLPSRLPSRPPSRQRSRDLASPTPRNFRTPGHRYRPSVSSTRVGPSLVAITEENSSSSSEEEADNADTSKTVYLGKRRKSKKKNRFDVRLEEEKAGLTPDDRKAYLYRVRAMFKELLKIQQDDDFINSMEADPVTIAQFKEHGEPKPNLADVCFDLLGDPSSIWNSTLFIMLRKEFLRREIDQLYRLPTMSDNYLKCLIKQRFSRLRLLWMGAMRERFADGTYETDAEVEARLVDQKELKLKSSRHRERRATKFRTRKRIIEGLVQLNQGHASGDKVWRWLGQLIDFLGVDGMSSEESGEEDYQIVYRVKHMEWRNKDTAEYLDLVDQQRHRVNGLFNKAGSKGVVKRRGTGAGYLISDRDPLKKLPIKLYNEEWFSSLGQHKQMELRVSNERFDWMKIHMRNN